MRQRRYTFAGPYIMTPDARQSPCRLVTVAQVKKAVSRHYHLRSNEMESARRSREVAHPRQVAMYLARNRTLQSLPQIGRMFGNRDHTTVMHAIKAVESRRKESPAYDAEVAILEASL